MDIPYQSYYVATFNLETKKLEEHTPNQYIEVPEHNCVVINLLLGPNDLYGVIIKQDGKVTNVTMNKYWLKRKLNRLGFPSDIMDTIHNIKFDRGIQPKWG